MPRNKRLHFKDLDAMRFMAFVPVFLYCFLYLLSIDQEDYFTDLSLIGEQLANNSLDFYFFLSAFLLTSHGLREYKYLESFSIRNFLVRRGLRISFLLIILMLFIFLGHPWLTKTLKLTPISIPSGAHYRYLIPNYMSTTNVEQFTCIIVSWSIFMFLQFYVVWMIILRFFKKYMLIIGATLIAVGVISRLIHLSLDSEWMFDTLSYATPIGVGAILAQLLRSDSKIIERIKTVPKKLNKAIYALGIPLMVISYFLADSGYFEAFIPVLTGVFFSYVVIEQTFGKNSFYKLRKNKVMTHLGRISFGLIVYQSILNILVLVAIDSLDFNLESDLLKLACIGTGFVLSWIAADVSYSLIERPLLVLRKEFKKT